MASAGTSAGMVVAPQPEAAEAGAEILRAGGGAVDAAVAVALVQGVVDPLQCGLGGFGSMAVHDAATGELRYLDFHARAPLRARPDMWEDRIRYESPDGFGFILDDHVNELGHGSVCVPATLRALHEAHARFGVLPWPAVVAPAVDRAERGWTVRPGVDWQFRLPSFFGHAGNAERLSLTAAGRALYLDERGRPLRMGATARNRDLAEVLRVVGRDGADAFYTGDIATAIVDDFAAHGGLLSRDDLAACRPTWDEPLWGSYRGLRVGTNRPPGGGPMLVEMLRILERFDLPALGHNSASYIALVAEVMKQATVDKDRYLGDPAFVAAPVDEILADAHADRVAARIRAGERVHVPRLTEMGESRNTTQACVVDRHGSCVSLTHTLGFPSGVITDGLGFMYNGGMASFDPRPGRTHSIAPGKARFSSIMPTVLYEGAEPCLVVGGVGATQIAMGVLQVVLNVVDFDRSMAEAVVEPRFCATSDVLEVVNRIPRSVTGRLEDLGHEVRRWPMSFGVAWVHGIRVRPDGTLDGAADPASDGVALAVA